MTEKTVEELRNAFRSLTHEVCRQLASVEVPKRPVWTVVTAPHAAPYVAMDVERPALSDLLFSLSIRLLRLPEYEAAADAVENDPDLRDGILVDAGGFLAKPERNNVTRIFITNFLRRYLREGERRDWDETRFDETFDELRAELNRKSVVFHTTLPLSNLKMDVAEIDLSEEIRLLPASIEELERWLNPDWDLPPPGVGRPLWNSYYVDKPGVLHARKTVQGQPRAAGDPTIFGQLPRLNVDDVITSLRLVMNAPISVIFREDHMEGLLAVGGVGTSWGWPPPRFGPTAILDQEKKTQVIHVRQLLQKSPNSDLLKLPLRRWESSLLRPNLEDRLIDTWISLEALLLGQAEGEFRYRAAVRLAEFLGSSGIHRKEIYDNARISYTWRSVLVHGGSSKKVAKRQQLEEAVRFTTEYLRSALLKVLDLPRRFDPERLETHLLSREGEGPEAAAATP